MATPIISGNLNKKKFRHGEVRDSDGKIFYSYLNVKLKSGKISKREIWIKEKSFKKIKQNKKKYIKENKEKISKLNQKKYIRNREKILKTCAAYRKKPDFKEKYNQYIRKRRKNDTMFYITSIMRGRIRSAIKKSKSSKCSKTIDLIGCSFKFLKQHIESQFKEGMSWENRKSFHIDHIRPLSSFDLTDPEQQKAACHWTNLQPLTPEENLRKAAKYEFTS
jgi:hypothetical protein